MHSPTDLRVRERLFGERRVAERLLRGGAVAALAITLVRLLLAAGAEPVVHHEQWSAAPSAVVRDSLAALARSGERVSWSGPVSAIAAMAEAVREPGPAVRISVIADSFAVVADTLGALDSLGAGGGTITLAAGGEGAGLAGDDAGDIARDGTVAGAGATLAMHATELGTVHVSRRSPRRRRAGSS